MASGSFAVSTSNAHVVGTCSWSSTANTAGNYSDVYIELRLSRNNTGYTTYGTGSFQVGINGVGSVDSGSKSFTITYNSNTLMVSGTIRVNHNADGTASVGIWADGNSDVFDVYAASGNYNLDTIPRASSLTSGCDWTAGTQNLAVTISRASTDFHHSVEVRVRKPDGSYVYVGARDNIATSTTFVFTQAENTTIYTALSQYENQPSWIRVITYNSAGSMIGYKDYYGTYYGVSNASISFADFNIGDSIPATISNMYSGFTYTGTMTFGSFTKTFTFDPATPNPTLTFTAAEVQSLFAQIPNANSGAGNFHLTSKYNGVEVNDDYPVSRDKAFTAKVVNSNPTFGTTYTYKDTNTTTTGITGDNQSIVQSKSTVLVEIPTTAAATAVNGATMSSYEASLNGVTKTAAYSSSATVSFDFGTVSAGADLTLTVTAIDSRGNRKATTKTVKIVPYSAPTIDATVSRLNNFEASTTLTLKGKASTMTVGGAIKNDVTTVQYRLKDTGTSTWGAWTNFAFTKALPDYTATNVNLTLDNVKSWNIQIQVIDKLSTSTADLLVNTGQPVLFPDTVKKAVGINKFPDAGTALDVNGDTQVTGGKVFAEIGKTGSSGNRGSSTNTWVRLGVATLTAQYTDATAHLEVFTSGSGNTVANKAKIMFRVKQQAALGSAPIVNVVLSSPINMEKDDFLAVTTVNTTAQTVVELWGKIDSTYDQLNYTVLGCNSDAIVWDKSYAVQASYSAGTVTPCISDDSMPSGVVQMWGGNYASPPTGWLLCNGQAVSRTAYPKLFAVIGTSFGAGDGSTTFNLPNMVGKVPVGLSTGETEFNTIGKTGGEKTHTLSTAEMPSHSHTYNRQNANAYGHTFNSLLGNTNYGSVPTSAGASVGHVEGYMTIDNTGGGGAHNNLQPYITMNFIIKY